jgi:protein-tyrosine phosphatase
MGDDTFLACVHNHLLPGVDDGAKDMDASLALLDQGLEDGIGAWMLTPHVVDKFTHEIADKHTAVFDELRGEVERRNLPVELRLASEIMFQPDLVEVATMPTATFDDVRRYTLIEFPMTFMPPGAHEALFELQLAGSHPIVAHPERNSMLVADRDAMSRMVDRGILMQINARSLSPDVPHAVRHVTQRLILDGLVHFVATDAHDPKRRPAHLRAAYDRIAEIAGEDTARRLCADNPRAAMEGRKVETVIPDIDEDVTWWRRLLDYFL